MRDNKNHVLFVLGRWTIGGVERMTVTLANAFVDRGWNVTVAAFKIEERRLFGGLHEQIVIKEIGTPVYRFASIIKLHRLIKKHAVTHIINQWAFPFLVTAMLRIAKPQSVRLVNVFHTMPGKSKRIQGTSGYRRKAMELLFRWNSRLVYAYSDVYIVLAESYKKIFKECSGIKKTHKLYAISNPFDIGNNPIYDKKDNLLLFVGRLSQSEKRVDRVIDTWRLIHSDLPDWRLVIIGDGPDRELLENMASGLPRIEFKGFCDPQKYYERAKIILLTSDFEGFPMTIVEAMSHRCVPVIFGSFCTASEIVGANEGVVVAPPWRITEYSASLLSLAGDEGRIASLSNSAALSVCKYDSSIIVDEYINRIT